MNEQFRAYVAEDELLARESLLAMFAAFPRWRVIGQADNGDTALRECLAAPPDLLLTDIRMPRLDGLELAAALRAGPGCPRIAFITAYDRHAVAAFRLAAVDYLLKPVTDAEFRECLERVEADLQRQRRIERIDATQPPLDALIRDQRNRLRQLVVRSVGRIEIVPLRDVIAFVATGNYVEVITPGRRLLHRQTMKSLCEQLDPAAFVQTHRTVIVAGERIRAIEKDGGKHREGWVVTLDDGSRYPVSANRHADLAQRLSAGE